MVLEGHERGVTSLAYSPTDKNLVSVSLDSTIRVWDVTRGE